VAAVAEELVVIHVRSLLEATGFLKE
jgi:hypothetical protein